MRTLSDSSIVQVSSALPSSTTMISCGTSWSLSSTWRCSTVDTMQPSSSRAGITTESNCNGAVPTGAILMRSLKLRAIQGGLERAALFLQGFARPEQWAANPTGASLWPNPARSRECHSGANQSRVPRSVFQNAWHTTRSTEPATEPNRHRRRRFACARLADQAIAFASRQAPPHLADAGSRALDIRVHQNQYT